MKTDQCLTPSNLLLDMFISGRWSKNIKMKIWRFSLLIPVIIIIVICVLYKDVFQRGNIVYGLSHIMDKPINCSSLDYRNFVYNKSSPPDLKALQSTIKSHIYSNRKSGYLVPNIIHYVWYTHKPKTFKFHHMLSVLSVIKFVKPHLILIHCNQEPVGPYWDKVKDLPNVKVIHREMSLCLFGEPLPTAWFETSGSNVDRLVILAETGGIYIDFDVVAVKSFDELRKYPTSIGLQSREPLQMCGAAIFSSSSSTFLNLWLHAFVKDYRMFTWAYNTGQVPADLWKMYPHLVHVEETKLMRPNPSEYLKIWGDEKYPWWENYAIHLYYRMWQGLVIKRKEPDYENIKTWNSTFGAIARLTLYDTYELMK